MTDQELLKLAIEKSGLSVRQFARQIVGREDRTIRRWIKGQPIPKAAKQWLMDYVELNHSTEQVRERKPKPRKTRQQREIEQAKAALREINTTFLTSGPDSEG